MAYPNYNNLNQYLPDYGIKKPPYSPATPMQTPVQTLRPFGPALPPTTKPANKPIVVSNTVPQAMNTNIPTPPPNMTPEQQRAWNTAIALIPRSPVVTQPIVPTIPTVPTIPPVVDAPTYKTPTIIDVETPGEKRARELQEAELERGIAPQDDQKLISDTLANFQAEIDQQNKLYDIKVAEARQEGKGRLGQSGAIQARRGLLGSDFGAAQTTEVERANQSIIDAINAERGAMISSILSKGRTQVAQEIKDRKAAREAGVKEYIEYQKTAGVKRKANIKELASSLVSQGIDPSEIDPKKLEELATNYGTSVENLTEQYRLSKIEYDKAKKVEASAVTKDTLGQTKTQAEIDEIKAKIAKGEYATVDLGDRIGVLDKITGKIISYTPKGLAPKASGDGGEYDLTPKQATLFNSLIAQQNKSPLIAAADRTPVLENSIKLIRANPKNAAQQLNLAYAYIQALDTYQSAVREGELANLNSIESKVGSLQGYIQKIQNGQIVRPAVILEIANAAETIVTTIKTSASAKSKSFRSQANVLGVGKAYDAYTSGYTPSYQQNTVSEQSISTDELNNLSPEQLKELQDLEAKGLI